MKSRHAGRIAVVLLMAALLTAVFALGGCGSSTEETSETTPSKTVVIVVKGTKTLKPGVLQMGSDTTYAPFEFMEGDTPVGFDVDLAKAVAARLGLKLQVVPTAWDGIIPGLKADKFDMLMSAMTITPDRAKEINFSSPYIAADQSIAVQNSNTTIKSEADLAGKVVGGQVNTTGLMVAAKIPGIKEIQKFDTIVLAFEALETGKIDAILNDYPVNAYMSKQRGKTKVVQKIITDEKYGMGVKQGNSQLLNNINAALAKTHTDGSYDTVFKKWFGAPEPGQG
jgi:polar amino acid transport system substrate-binding protein